MNFDDPISRQGTHALKYEARQRLFGSASVQPLWVADMDFAAPPAVVEALESRARHPIYGYTEQDAELFHVQVSWCQHRHGWSPDEIHMMLVPGVVPSLYAAVAAFTQPGDAVIIQPPVYPPFFSAIAEQERRVLENPLCCVDGRYVMDLDHFEVCARQARLFLLCSPHNPVGRVWSDVELHALLAICERHDVLVLADEIHADLLLGGTRHTPLAKLAPHRVITAIAPSKTFNIPGLGLSTLVAANAMHRQQLQKVFDHWHVSVYNPFSQTAFIAAYQHGEAWLDALLSYLVNSRDLVLARLGEVVPTVRSTCPEATYLLWLDFSALGWSDKELQQRLVKVGLGLNPGPSFGQGGQGHMRLNFAAPRYQVMDAINLLSKL